MRLCMLQVTPKILKALSFLFFIMNSSMSSHLVSLPIAGNAVVQTDTDDFDLEISGNVSYDGSVEQLYSNLSEAVTTPRERKRQPYYAIIVLIASVLSVVINLRVFFIVTADNRRRARAVSILVAHLSLMAIVMVIIFDIYVAEKWSIASWIGPGLCELLSFLRHIMYEAFPLNVVGIIYERVRTFRMAQGKLLVLRTISLIWMVAVVGSIPSIFLSSYYYDHAAGMGKCKQTLMFGSFGLTLAFEVFRFSVYHLLVVGYMAYALYQIRSKIRYLFLLKPIPNERMKRKVQRVRFVYLHATVFIVVWLPSGLFLLLYKLLSRKGMFIYLMKPFAILALITYIYLILNPLIYVCLNEDMTKIRFCWIPCHTWFSKGNREIEATKEGENGISENSHGDIITTRETSNCGSTTLDKNIKGRSPIAPKDEQGGLERSRKNMKQEGVSRKKRSKIRNERLSEISRIASVTISITSEKPSNSLTNVGTEASQKVSFETETSIILDEAPNPNAENEIGKNFVEVHTTEDEVQVEGNDSGLGLDLLETLV